MSQFTPGFSGGRRTTPTKDYIQTTGALPWIWRRHHGEWQEFNVLFQSDEPLAGLRLDLGGVDSRLEIDSMVLQSVPKQ